MSLNSKGFYLIGMWYKRSEAQKRFTFFFSSTSLAGAFSGLLAAALSHMVGLQHSSLCRTYILTDLDQDGLRGYHAWRWVFIIEGLLTCVVSFLFFFAIPDFPENARFLTGPEREFWKRRIEEDQGRSALERPITFRDVIGVLKDYKVEKVGRELDVLADVYKGHCWGIYVLRSHCAGLRYKKSGYARRVSLTYR